MNLWSGYPTVRQPPPAPQITFVLHDAGETKALAPVMRTLDHWQVNYSILAASTAKSLLKGNPHLAPLPQDVAALSQVSPQAAAWGQWQLNRALGAGCAVVGLASDFQKDWAQRFRKLGKRVIGYYDGFGYNLRQNRADAFQNCLSELITPSRDTADFFRRRFPGVPVRALGQPVLETAADTSAPMQADRIRQQLNLNPQQPTALFVGGYGPGYAEAFSLFCESIRQCGAMNALVSLHPKTDGRLEAQWIRAYGLQHRIRIIPRDMDTLQILPVSDAILTHQSTMATQALLQGKKVALLGQVGSTFRQDEFNPATYYKLAPRCTTSKDLVRWMQGALSQAQSPLSGTPATPANANSLYGLLGIPLQATRNISQFLLSRLPYKMAGNNRPATS